MQLIVSKVSKETKLGNFAHWLTHSVNVEHPVLGPISRTEKFKIWLGASLGEGTEVELDMSEFDIRESEESFENEDGETITFTERTLIYKG